MPQFDLMCYSTQVFWTCASFFFFYFVLLVNYLPLLCTTLKLREKRRKFLDNQKSKVCLYSEYIRLILKK